jgi:hypothetical protein
MGAADDGLVAVSGRLVTVPPTEATIAITVRTDVQKTLDDVLAKVRDLGLAVEHLATIVSTPAISTGVPGIPGVPGSNSYTFRTSVPFAQATPTLQRVQQFSNANADYRTDASVAGVTASLAATLEAQKRVFPDLYREARARADEMARGAGLSPGKVLAVVESYQLAALAGFYTTVQIPMSVAVRIAVE